MDNLLEFWEIPVAEEIYMVAGWQQWADAGAISSGLPQYLIEVTKARKIGLMKSEGFYLFQIPGMHHFLRPQVKLEEGHRVSLPPRENEFYYAGDDKKGLVIFLGEEPHLYAEQYADAFFDAVQALGVKRVIIVGGVYGAMPYDKDREISCVYSLPRLKEELNRYAVRFSSYEGGTTIGTYLADRAEYRDVELVVFYGFVPAYDFSQLSTSIQGFSIENDFKAWYDLVKRINYMFDMTIDLEELAAHSDQLALSIEAEIEKLDEQVPELQVREYIESLSSEFNEKRFIPLGDMWTRGLRDLFDKGEETL